MQDDEVIPLLLQLRYPTLFTLDFGFYQRRLCHGRYCLAYLDIYEDEVASFVRRFLRHPEFDTQAKRMGSVARISMKGLVVWRPHAEQEVRFFWPRQDPGSR